MNVYREDRYALAALYGDFYTQRGLIASSLFQRFLSLETVTFLSFEEKVASPELRWYKIIPVLLFSFPIHQLGSDNRVE